MFPVMAKESGRLWDWQEMQRWNRLHFLPQTT
jgi:hypothetical protein